MAGRDDKEFLIRVRADIRDAVRDLKRTRTEIDRTGDEARRAEPRVRGLGSSFRFLASAAAVYAAVRTASAAIRQADAFNVLQQRIRTATKATGDYNQVADELLQISIENGIALQDTVSVFQNLARVGPDLGATNEQILDLVNLVQQLGVIGGATRPQLAAGLLQFSQGLSEGIFRAEEYNSLLTNLPELASRLADGLGVSAGELRRMVREGRLLSRDVFDALIKQSEEIQNEFENIDASIDRTQQSIGTSISRLLGLLDQKSGITDYFNDVGSGLVEGINAIADALDSDSLEAQERHLANLQQQLKDLREAPEVPGTAQNLRIQLKEQEIEKTKEQIALLKEQRKEEKKGLEIVITKTKYTADKDQEAVDKILDKLKEQRATMALTNEEALLLQLQLEYASDAELQFARSVVESIEAQRKQQSIMEAGQAVIEETRTKQEELADELDRLHNLYQQGAFGPTDSARAMDTYSRAVVQAQENIADLGDAGKTTFQELENAIHGWGREFSDTLAEMVVEGEASFKQLAQTIIKELLEILFYQQLVQPVLGYFGVGEKHSGGVVGSPNGVTRQVSPAAFAGAQRYHAGGVVGLRPDEVPIIAQRGEVIIPRDQVGRAAPGATNVRFELINKGTGKRAIDGGQRLDGHEIVKTIILEDIGRGGEISQGIEALSERKRGRGL